MGIPADKPRLDSWKEIAAHLACDQRTAKRWETTRGLPVHRLPGARSGVFAFEGEINAWKRQGSPELPGEAIGDGADSSREMEIVKTPLREAGGGLLQWRKAWATGLTVITVLAAGSVLVMQRWSSHRQTQQKNVVATAMRPMHVPTKEVEDLYLNGRYYWNRRTAGDLRQALELFKQATEQDPQYAPAYAGMADTYFLMVEFAGLSPKEAYPPAIAAAREAILLDPSMPEAHRSLAFSLFYWNWDRVGAEKEFRRAIELDPHDATAHHWFANMLMASHRNAEALMEIEKARELDPASISIMADRSHLLPNLGRGDEAAATLLAIAKTDPRFLSAHRYLAEGYRYAKNEKAYIEELRKIAEITKSEGDAEVYRAASRGFAEGGEKGMLRKMADADLRLYEQGQAAAFDVALALANAGRTDEAVRYLNLSYMNHDTQFLIVTGETVFPMLKGDADFERLAVKSLQPYPEMGLSKR